MATPGAKGLILVELLLTEATEALSGPVAAGSWCNMGTWGESSTSNGQVDLVAQVL